METILFFGEFSELAEYLKITEKQLWDLGICGDDCDYLLVVEDKEEKDIYWRVTDNSKIGLLHGSCSDEGKNIVVKGKKYWVGGAYHA